MIMTQEMINKEKEDLMNRIKKTTGVFHTITVIDLIYTAVLSILFLILLLDGDESIHDSEFYGFLLLVFVALAISFVMWRYSASLKSISDAEEYLQQYDKFQCNSIYWSVIPLAVVVSVTAFLLWGAALAIVVLIGWAIVILAGIGSGVFKNRDIERLRELLGQEDNVKQD